MLGVGTVWLICVALPSRNVSRPLSLVWLRTEVPIGGAETRVARDRCREKASPDLARPATMALAGAALRVFPLHPITTSRFDLFSSFRKRLPSTP